MQVATPSAFWLFSLLTILVPVAVRSYLLGKRDLKKLVGAWRGFRFLNVYLVKTFFSRLLFLLFFVFAVFALADVRWGEKLVADERKGFDVALAVDVSRSMLAADIEPTRMDAVISRLRRFIGQAKDARFSIVAFKGEAHVLLPMTDDTDSVAMVIDNLWPDILTSGSSDLQKGLEAALAAFVDGGRYRSILLLSDGESLSGKPAQAAREAARRGIPIFAAAVGTGEGSRIVLPDGSVVRDKRGREVTSRLHRKTLEAVSSLSGGKVYGLNELDRMWGEMPLILKGMEREQPTEGLRLVKKERTPLFLLLGIAALLAVLTIRSLKWKDVL
jgi:Ca-activated chloride channel family protein